MGRLIPLRHRRSNLYAVKETVAALNEELEFTLNYAHAMTRGEHYHAAAEVIEEQRRSLAVASERMHEAAAAPQAGRSRVRVRAALAGVAAAMAIASGAFASLGGTTTPRPQANPRIQAIQQATAALSHTSAISDPLALQSIVVQAQNTILGIAQAAPSDPAIKRSLLDSIEKLKTAVGNPNVPAKVREQAKRVAERVEKIVVATADAPEQSTPSTESPPSPDASV